MNIEIVVTLMLTCGIQIRVGPTYILSRHGMQAW